MRITESFFKYGSGLHNLKTTLWGGRRTYGGAGRNTPIKIINDRKLLSLRESNKRAHNRCCKRWVGEREEAQ